MAAPTKKITSGGLNAGWVIGLDTNGYPAATSPTTVFEGLSLGGPSEFAYTVPDPTTVVWIGNNGVIQQDIFPATDPSTATLTLSRNDADVYALLSGTLVAVVGEANVTIAGHNDQGNEPTVALITYAQSKDDAGNRRWTTYVFPKIICVPKKPGMSSRTPSNHIFNCTPQRTTNSITGTALVAATNGATSAELWIYESNYRLHFAAWKANASATVFTFDTDRPAASTAGIAVWVNGVLKTLTTDYTVTTTAVTFGSAPASNAMVVVQYELADTAIDIE